MEARGQFVDGLFRLMPEPGVYAIEALVTKAIQRQKPQLELSDEEAAYRYRLDFWNRLSIRQNALTTRGLTPQFLEVDPSQRLLKWNDSKNFLTACKVKIRPKVLDFLDYLSDREYEYACGVACEFAGAELTYVTPPGNEYGIDFVSIIPAYGRSSVICAGKEGLRIVGQSKKYTAKIPREKVMLLAESINMIKNRKPEITRLLPGWFFSSRAPIAGWIVGHSGFQSGCTQHAADHGIILSDSLELADILSAPRTFQYGSNISIIPDTLAARIEQQSRTSVGG